MLNFGVSHQKSIYGHEVVVIKYIFMQSVIDNNFKQMYVILVISKEMILFKVNHNLGISMVPNLCSKVSAFSQATATWVHNCKKTVSTIMKELKEFKKTHMKYANSFHTWFMLWI